MTCFLGKSQPTIFSSFTELSGNQLGETVSEKKNCHVGSDLQNCGTSSQLLLRCDDLEKNF